jgi:3-hydroxyisobutyrate dehydrogenase-like beta-hydroxyacid dehydrogenase
MGSRIIHVGPLGSAAILKLAINVIVYGLNGAVSEALVLAERAGIAREVAYEAIASSAAAAPFVHYRRETFERPGEVPVAFRLTLAEKDMKLALDLAFELRHSMPQAQTNQAILKAAADNGFADHDVSAVAEYLRQMQTP